MSRVVASRRALRKRSHDVRAADEERELDGLPDEELLSLAAAEQRILVTFNVADFPRIFKQWAEAGRSHAGCAIVVDIDHSHLGTILRVLERTLADRPDPKQWNDYTCFVAKTRLSTEDRPRHRRCRCPLGPVPRRGTASAAAGHRRSVE